MDRAIFMSSNEWKLPFNIAVSLHILVLVCSLYLPDIFKAKPKFADIYTVSIINVTDTEQPPPAPEPAQPKPEVAPVPVKPAQTKKIAPIAEIQPAPKAESPKAVSLKPLKRKKKKAIKTVDNRSQKIRQQRLEREKQAALQEEKLLEERARLAQEALEAERKLLTQPRTPSPAVSKPTSTSRLTQKSTGGSNRNLIESQYFAAIVNRLHQFWALPENLQKDPNLTAVAVITIKKNGKIANLMFESKSGDRVFDQFVRKAIRSADPLPPIPSALKRQRYEIGLRFKPGSIQ